MMNGNLRMVAFVWLLALIALGCKGPVELTIQGAEDMNEGNAVTVVYFQLKSDATFTTASIASFWANDNAVLNNDLAGASKQSVILAPSGEAEIDISLEKDANFVAFAASYRSPAPDGWRIIYPVSEVKGKSVRLTATRDRLFAEIQ